MSKEAIAKLEKAITEYDGPMIKFYYAGANVSYYLAEQKLFDQALAILNQPKDQQSNSEFIKNCHYFLGKRPITARAIIENHLTEACRRLDTSEQQRKDLLIVIKKFGQHSQECRDERYPERWHCVCGLEAVIAKDKTG